MPRPTHHDVALLGLLVGTYSAHGFPDVGTACALSR
jgi:hypothetical protein